MAGLYNPDGSYRVTIVNAETPVEITGDANIDNTGVEEKLDSVIGLLTDILAELEAHTVLLTAIEANQ